ncbi:MAG: hypothetical protein WDW38_005637 [Sanguina aurantia]
MSSCAPRLTPFKSAKGPSRSCQTQAAENSTAPTTPAAIASTGPPPTVIWALDQETTREVFAFDGSAPERTNGRAAMIGFTNIMFSEMGDTHTAWSQLSDNWFGILLFGGIITLASIMPKVVSGTSLKTLHATATGRQVATIIAEDGPLKVAGSIFDTSVEMFLGRTAMMGLVGLVLVEAIKGSPVFHP